MIQSPSNRLHVKTDSMPLIVEPEGEAKQDSPESLQRTARIRIKNRRKMYLDQHPSYFTSPDLELAGASILLDHQRGRLTSIRSITV
jgi:hypothetical protein